MRTFKIYFALVVLFLLTASTYTSNAQTADTVTVQKIYNTVNYPVSYPTYKPKPQPSYYPFFNNGVTGASEVVNRIAGPRYVSIRDYHGAKQFSYAELLTEHLSALNKKYEWGFVSVNIDTVVYILNHSRESYEPFGKGQYTIFYFDRNGVPMPINIGSGNEPDKLIVFNNVAFIHCPTGGLMMPATEIGSYSVRNTHHRSDVTGLHPYVTGQPGFLYWNKQDDFYMVRHYARMHGMDAVMTPNGPYLFVPDNDSLSFSEKLETTSIILLIIAFTAFVIWLVWFLVTRRRATPESTIVISISNSITIVLGEEDESIDPSTHTID